MSIRTRLRRSPWKAALLVVAAVAGCRGDGPRDEKTPPAAPAETASAPEASAEPAEEPADPEAEMGEQVEAPRDVLTASPPAEVGLGQEPVTVEVPLTEAARERLLELASTPGRLRLVIEGLQLLRPGVHYQVYLSLPAGAKPDPLGPHFVGHVALFAEPGHEPMSRSFDVSRNVQALRARGLWKDEVRVTFVPAASPESLATAPGSGPFFRFRRVALVER